MLKLTINEECYSVALNRELCKFACSKVANLIRIAMEIIEDNSDYEFRYIFPSSYVEKHSREDCCKVMNIIYERMKSAVMYEEFTPLQQYILNNVIEGAIELGDDNEELVNLVNYVLPNWLIDKIKEECSEDEAKYVSESLTDLHNYVGLFFEDIDFDENSIRGLVEMATHYPESFLSMMNYDELEKYVEVMPSDVAEDYMKFRESTYYPAVMSFQKMKETGDLDFIDYSENDKKTSWEVSLLVLERFKDFTEHNKGWELINRSQSNMTEKVVQKLIQLIGKDICDRYDADMSFEPNEGPGPVDMKISRGTDKTIVEIKLSSNSQYMHGFTDQIEQYARAEKCNQRIFVYVKNECHPNRDKNIQDKYNEEKEKGSNPPFLFVVDALPKQSASKSSL